MTSVPPEFLGAARTFRASLVAGHAEAVAAVDRIAAPLLARWRLRQAPSPVAYARAAGAWDAIPGAGRLTMRVRFTPSSLEVDELRAAPAGFRFEWWGEGEFETAVVLARHALHASPGRFRFDAAPIASVPLRAVARRLQRGWGNSDAAVRADLRLLGDAHSDLLARGGEFALPTADGGSWVGAVAEVPRGVGAERVLVVRTFLSAGMGARGGGAAPGGCSNKPGSPAPAFA